MTKKVLRLVSVLLSVLIFLSLPACNSAGYKVTGKIEDGKLTVWLSPIMSLYYAASNSIPLAMADSCGFNEDVKIVSFSSSEEFTQSLAQDIMTNKPPDVILATPNEMSSKTITSGMLTDLRPFFDYADKTGTIKKDDLMTQIMDGFSFDGKLYTVPLMFAIQAIGVNADKDKSEGLSLLEQPNLTFDKYLSQVYQWIDKHGEDHFYQIDEAFPNVFYAWKDFIDYKDKTTRMDEDQIYKYFCLQVNKVNTSQDPSWAYTKATGNSTDTDEGEKAAFNWYFSTLIYNNLSTSLGYTRSETQASLTKKPSNNKYMPYITDNGTGYIANVQVMAAVPANSNRKEKAFAFISTAFNPEVLNNNKDAFNFTPMLKSVIRTDIDNIQYLNNTEKDDLYSKITKSKYICTWVDAQIAKWFNDFYGYDSDTQVSNHVVPTREQWNALKKKIELYLSE